MILPQEILCQLNLRGGESGEEVVESLAVLLVEQPAEGPHETEEVEPLDVQLAADLHVLRQHGRQKVDARLEHTDFT